MTKKQWLPSALPIIQAPMAGVQGVALAAAVSNAGGLGSLPCAMLDAAALERALAELDAATAATERPYNLNFFCHQPLPADAAREAHWRQLLSPYFAELGVDPDAVTPGAQRAPFSDEIAAVVEPYRPAVVSFHFGLPSEPLLARVKSWGSLVLSSATTVEEAQWLAARGADAVIAQGLEAGGHRGHFLSHELERQLGTFALVPQLVEAVDVPVIAAGGIADAAGVAAALALGASAVQLGTAYLLCPEATTSAVHRRALTGPEARYTALTNLFSGRAARGIVNRVMRELGPINGSVPEFPHASASISALRSAAEKAGSGDFSPLWCGQNASGCRALPAAELTRLLAAGLPQ